jgi:hypothetical protein
LRWDISAARAFSLWASSGLPTVVVNESDALAGRIFSLFHEHWHVLWRETGVCAYEEDGPGRREERRAEEFAAALLMPPDVVTQELHALAGEEQGGLTPPRLRDLAGAFRVSEEAMLLRLRDLGLVGPDEYRRHWLLLRQRPAPLSGFAPGRTRPALSLARSGRWFARLVLDAAADGYLSYADALRQLRVGLDDLDELEMRLSGSL